MKKINWYEVGKWFVGVGSVLSLVGLGLINIYEDYRPREYVQWAMVGDEPDILNIFESNKKKMEVRAYDGTIVEENIKFYAQVEDPEQPKWGKILDNIGNFLSSCSPAPKPPETNPNPTPEPTPPPTRPNPTPNPGTQREDWGYAKIQAGEANNITKGSGITVCVGDTGVDLSHTDVKVSKYTSFAGSYSGAHGHGTHVSGIIAALDNGIGSKGAGSEINIISAQVLGVDGSGSLDGIAYGIKWCVDQGAQVINLSLGGGGPTQLMYQAIMYATQKGVKVMAAAGNDAGPTNYPAAYTIPGLYAISATTPQDTLAQFSSRGKIEFAAPGLNIYSTMPMNGCGICGGSRGWGMMSGTSMATPYASGVMALALSRGKMLQGDLMGNPRDYGQGRINALKSVQ